MDAFRLTKWYLDAVDEQGRSAIAYWTRVAWGPLALGWEGLSLHPGDGAPQHRSARTTDPDPAWSAGSLVWRSRGLGCEVRCEPWCEPYQARLLDSADGSIEWSCEAPGAAVTMDLGGGCAIHGTGYAERIVLSIVPWRVPIAELRWGRWLSSRTRRSLVWIDWRGERPLTLVLDGGHPREPAAVSDEEVSIGGGDAQTQAGGARLHLAAGVTLHSRTISNVLSGLGPLAARLPASWLALEDRKTRSLGTLRDAGGEPDTGWAIHELVRFPNGKVPL